MGRLRGLTWTSAWKLKSTPAAVPNGVWQEEARLLLTEAIIMVTKQNAQKEKVVKTEENQPQDIRVRNRSAGKLITAGKLLKDLPS